MDAIRRILILIKRMINLIKSRQALIHIIRDFGLLLVIGLLAYNVIELSKIRDNVKEINQRVSIIEADVIAPRADDVFSLTALTSQVNLRREFDLVDQRFDDLVAKLNDIDLKVDIIEINTR